MNHWFSVRGGRVGGKGWLCLTGPAGRLLTCYVPASAPAFASRKFNGIGCLRRT